MHELLLFHDKAWDYLQSFNASRNKAVISAINASLEPVNAAMIKAVKEAVQDCFQNVLFVQVESLATLPEISDDESALLDSLDNLLGV